MPKTIVTHTNPDLDAVTGVWLLKRFHAMAEAEVAFVNTGNPDPDVLAEATAVVDTGREFDDSRLRFDHHHLPGQAANDTCAARQVYEFVNYFLYSWSGSWELDYLRPLVDLVFAGDTGRDEANQSRELGLHAIFAGYKSRMKDESEDGRVSDMAVLQMGFSLLDALETRLRKQVEVKRDLAQKVVYKSDDGQVWGIRHGTSGHAFAAYEAGARVVVFEGEPTEVEGGTTYPVGIMRAGEWQEPHVGELVETILAGLRNYTATDGQAEAIYSELDSWFKHPAGFFAGRGTPKAPVFEPVEIDLAWLAAEVSDAWERE
jgi:hypothetical protein